jgi:DNA-binding SARP family transcriptional activator
MVRVAGQDIHHFRSHKTLALLAYLIVERRWVARDHLALLFWPDAPLDEGRGHLRRALYDLSHKIPGCILAQPQLVAFNTAFLPATDLDQFDRLAAAGDLASLEAAAALCRGVFLEGMECSGCSRFEDWLRAEREIRRRNQAEILSTLLELYLQGGQLSPALDYAWRLVRLQPWREDRYRWLMILLARTGDPAQALRVYKKGIRALADEIDLEPSGEMVALEKKIRLLLTKSPTNLPGVLLPVGGDDSAYESECDCIRRWLAYPACRLITISGAAVPDRIRLAIQAGLLVNGLSGYLFLDGVYLIRPSPSTPVASLNAAIARTLRLTAKPRELPAGLLTQFLRDKEMLLILASETHQFLHPAELRAVMDAGPGIKLLVTAPERLAMVGEWTMALGQPETPPCRDEAAGFDVVSYFLEEEAA